MHIRFRVRGIVKGTAGNQGSALVESLLRHNNCIGVNITKHEVQDQREVRFGAGGWLMSPVDSLAAFPINTSTQGSVDFTK